MLFFLNKNDDLNANLVTSVRLLNELWVRTNQNRIL